MQVDPDTVAKYKKESPELLDAVTSGEAEHIMKRNPESDYCVKFDAGWCSIHREKGSSFLGDACHFFPRITRSLGATPVMTAALSCPEITRLALFGEDGFTHLESSTDRLPWSLTDYLPDDMDETDALAVHRAFLEAAGDESVSPEHIMARLGSVARSLQMLDIKSWPAAVAFYLKQADGRLPEPEEDIADPFNLLHGLAGLIGAAKPSPRPRLEQTLCDMEEALNVTVDRSTLALTTSEASPRAYLALRGAWRESWATYFGPVLRRWIQAELAASLFPFSGLGENLTDRITILAVRFTTVRLALMACCQTHNGIPPEEESIRVIQSLARFLDHLADPALSLAMYQETGWTLEARARGLLEI